MEWKEINGVLIFYQWMSNENYYNTLQKQTCTQIRVDSPEVRGRFVSTWVSGVETIVTVVCITFEVILQMYIFDQRYSVAYPSTNSVLERTEQCLSRLLYVMYRCGLDSYVTTPLIGLVCSCGIGYDSREQRIIQCPEIHMCVCSDRWWKFVY